jgi:glutathione S-transferase
MPDLTLYHGNKNYSSWSLRVWLTLKRTGVEFDEVPFNLGAPGARELVSHYSPTAKVPVLRHGELVIWDSLAICEYLAETFPAARLWPADSTARAVARSISAEMHSGFPLLRANMPMNIRRSCPGKGRVEGIQEEFDRIVEIWEQCRTLFGKGGPFLFNEVGIADFMYAPVVTRFTTYAVPVGGIAAKYMQTIWSMPVMQEWRAAAEIESGVIPHYDL